MTAQSVQAFWQYVQDVAKKYRFYDGSVDWVSVKKQVDKEMQKISEEK